MLNRKEKRMLKADKSLVCGLYNIIDKYLPEFFIMFDNLTDAGQKGKVINQDFDGIISINSGTKHKITF